MTQLTLIPTHEWALDEDTKRIGRNGVASAREVLARTNAVNLLTVDEDATTTALTAGAATATTGAPQERPLPLHLADARELLAA